MSLEASQRHVKACGCAVQLSKHSQPASTSALSNEQNTVVVSTCLTSLPADVKAPCQCLFHSTVTMLAETLQPLSSSYVSRFVGQALAGSAPDTTECKGQGWEKRLPGRVMKDLETSS